MHLDRYFLLTLFIESAHLYKHMRAGSQCGKRKQYGQLLLLW